MKINDLQQKKGLLFLNLFNFFAKNGPTSFKAERSSSLASQNNQTKNHPHETVEGMDMGLEKAETSCCTTD